MNTNHIYVGIDVSKFKHDVCIMNQDFTFLKKKFTFDNTLSGYQSLINLVNSFDFNSISFGMEVTGNYGLNLYNHLLHDGYDVIMIKPDSVTKYRKYKGLPKNDKIDAKMITEILVRNEAVASWVPQKGYAYLKQLVHRREQVSKTISQEKTRLISLIDVVFPDIQTVFKSSTNTMYAVINTYPTPYSIINASFDELNSLIYEASKHRLGADKALELVNAAKDSIAMPYNEADAHFLIDTYLGSIKCLSKHLKLLDKQIDILSCDFPLYKILLSFTGCGNYTASVVLCELGDVTRFKSGSKIVSFAGLYGNNSQSGSSVNVDGRMSKKGSRVLRHALYIIAEFARRRNPILKEFFIKKKQGKKKRHILAVNAVANKVCHILFSMMKHNSNYIIYYSDLMRLPELTRDEFFQNIELNITKKTRKQSYLFEDNNGEIHPFTFNSKQENSLAFE